MINPQKDALFLLIKSLTKSEKRQFKVYVNRLEGNSNSKFIKIFNILEKSNKYNEDELLITDIVKKQQLSNLKAHLYKQILISLRLNPVNQNLKIQLREQLDFANILFDKGLYNQGIKLLEKAKLIALKNEEFFLASDIIEFEKIIKVQYLPKDLVDDSDMFFKYSKELAVKREYLTQLSSLSIKLYVMILQTGYARSKVEAQQISRFFYTYLPTFVYKLSFKEKLLFNVVNFWHNYLIQNFLNCYKYANKWVDIYIEYGESAIQSNSVYYLKGNNYLLELLSLIKYKSKFQIVMNRLEQTINDDLLPKTTNIKLLSFIYIYSNKVNYYFIDGQFSNALHLIPIILDKIKSYESIIDFHYVMVFYYKIACIYFGVEDYKMCIKYLNLIIKNKETNLRKDFVCFARILNLVAHYEEQLDYELEIELKRTYRFLLKMNDLHDVQKEMIKFLKKIPNIYPNDVTHAFKTLYERFLKIEEKPYERRAFLYLNINSWLKSKIENKPISEIIQKEYKQIESKFI